MSKFKRLLATLLALAFAVTLFWPGFSVAQEKGATGTPTREQEETQSTQPGKEEPKSRRAREKELKEQRKKQLEEGQKQEEQPPAESK